MVANLMLITLALAAVTMVAVSGASCDSSSVGIDEFEGVAKSLTPTTDKVTLHRYQTMYGIFLHHHRTRTDKIKMFEIGLGCDMGYGE